MCVCGVGGVCRTGKFVCVCVKWSGRGMQDRDICVCVCEVEWEGYVGQGNVYVCV